MAHRIAKARRQRERALEPLPVRLRPLVQQVVLQVVPARLLQEQGLAPLPVPDQALQLARARGLDPVARALVKALEQEQPTIRPRGGKLPVPIGRKATRRN